MGRLVSIETLKKLNRFSVFLSTISQHKNHVYFVHIYVPKENLVLPNENMTHLNCPIAPILISYKRSLVGYISASYQGQEGKVNTLNNESR